MRRFATLLGAAAGAATASRVNAHIYIGGYLAAGDPGFVRRAGITRIVKMFEDDKAYPGGFHRHPGVAYAVYPALDLPGYDIRAAACAALRFIREGVDAGERVLVHCHAGVSRSATVVLLYLMVYHGLGLDEALALLRKARPIVNPNAGFMRHLRATDGRLRALRAPCGRATDRGPQK
jgi:hypothetical protein